jgi:hypothetical protein
MQQNSISIPEAFQIQTACRFESSAWDTYHIDILCQLGEHVITAHLVPETSTMKSYPTKLSANTVPDAIPVRACPYEHLGRHHHHGFYFVCFELNVSCLLGLLLKCFRNVLFLPFRRTHSVSLSDAIKQYISSKYDQHPDMFRQDLEVIDNLRRDAVNVKEPHVSGLKKIAAYAGQLSWIGGKFPIDVCLAADFEWIAR